MRLTRLIRSAEKFTELWKEILDYVEHFEIGGEVERTENRVKKVEGKFCYQQKAGVLFGVYGPRGGLKHYVAEVFQGEKNQERYFDCCKKRAAGGNHRMGRDSLVLIGKGRCPSPFFVT